MSSSSSSAGLVRPNLDTCYPSGPLLSFPNQCQIEVEMVRWIQGLPIPHLDVVSEVLHPKYAIVIGLSVAYYLNPHRVAHYYVVGCWAACDAAHFILKQYFQGDRPYWVEGSNLKEFSHTCEAGYGFPSGHTCILATVFGSLYKTVLSKSVSKIRYKLLMFFMVGFSIIMMMISRSFTGSHFPIQTFIGMWFGIAFAIAGQPLGEAFRWLHSNRKNMKPLQNVLSGFVCLTIPGVFYACQLAFQKMMRRDVYHSVKLAHAACEGSVRQASVWRGPLWEILGISVYLALHCGRPMFFFSFMKKPDKKTKRAPPGGVADMIIHNLLKVKEGNPVLIMVLKSAVYMVCLQVVWKLTAALDIPYKSAIYGYTALALL